MDLVDQIKQQFSDSDIHQLSSLIGASEGATRSAVGAAVPSILSALSRLASSGAGAQKLVSALGQMNVGPSGTVSAQLSDRTGAVFEKGSSLLNSLFAGNALTGIQNGISRFAGVAWGGCQKLLSILTPTILGTIANRFAGTPVNAQGLVHLFSQEKASIVNAIPSGLGDVTAAVGDVAAGVGRAAGPVHHGHSAAVRSVAEEAERAANSSMKWLLPALLALLALALIVWWAWPKAAPVSNAPPAVPELSAPAQAWKTDVTSAVGAFTDTLAGIKDAASVDAAVPKLREVERRLGDAQAKIADVPTVAKTTVSSLLKPTLGSIQETVNGVLRIPGATEKIKPLLDSIMAKLAALAA